MSTSSALRTICERQVIGLKLGSLAHTESFQCKSRRTINVCVSADVNCKSYNARNCPLYRYTGSWSSFKVWTWRHSNRQECQQRDMMWQPGYIATYSAQKIGLRHICGQYSCNRASWDGGYSRRSAPWPNHLRWHQGLPPGCMTRGICRQGRSCRYHPA